jgi:ligand-binding SRPBCC domain-containing protein
LGIHFIDEQRIGPYRIWHHEHHLHQVSGHVVMEDIIHYEIPFGIFGDLVNALLVRRQLCHIFDYRHQIVESLFGKAQ